MVAERLDGNDQVHGFLAFIQRDVHTPLPLLDGPAWRVAWAPWGQLFWLITVGLLPPPCATASARAGRQGVSVSSARSPRHRAPPPR
jgi:hypothetical protein